MIEDQEFYWKLLDTLVDGVYFVNRERKITYWNRGAEAITGYRSSEVLGKHCGDNILIHIDDSGASLCKGPCPLAGVLKNGVPAETMIYLQHKDGHRVPVFVRVNPVKNSKGQIIGAVEIFSDYSYRALFRERMNQLEKRGLASPLVGLPNREFLEMTLKTRFWEFREFHLAFGVIQIRVQPAAPRDGSDQESIRSDVMNFISNTFLNNISPLDAIGQWDDHGVMLIIGDVNLEKLREIENFYRLMLKKSRIFKDITGIGIFTGSALAKADDTGETLVKRSTDLLEILK